MALDSSNSQFGAEVEYKPLDRGTPAWGVKPGPAAVDPIPPVPGSTVAGENFDDGTAFGGLINLASNPGNWFITNTESHSPPNSFRSPLSPSVGIYSFTINDFTFSPQLSFWYRNDIALGQNAGFRLLFDGNLVLDLYETPVLDWTRFAIATNFAFNIEFRFVVDSTFSDPHAAIDDVVFGSLDIPGVPGAPAHPLIYVPLQLDDNDNLKVTVLDGTVSVTGEVNTRPLTCETDSVTACIDDVIEVSGTVSVVLDDPVTVTGTVETRPLDCLTDSVTVCPGQDPIVVVPGTCFPVNVRLDCEVDSVTVCPPVTGVFEVQAVDYPPAATLTDDTGPFSFTGPGTILDNTYRAFTMTVLQGPVVINGLTVPTGFSLSRSADPGGTVPGLTFNGTGGEIIIDALREL